MHILMCFKVLCVVHICIKRHYGAVAHGRQKMENISLKSAIYDACLASAIAMKDDIKSLSWFGKNHASQTDVTQKEAA